jgi:predicted RNase H-like nuclease (RuvC/YqgF family)
MNQGSISPLHNVILQSRHQVRSLGPHKHSPKRRTYSTVKPSSFSFIEPARSFVVKSKPTHSPVKSLDFITLEADSLVDAKKRIRELEAAVDALSVKLEEMREVNKKLLTDKLSVTAGESQSMFQQLLLTDLHGTVDTLTTEYLTLREQNEELKKRVDVLTKDKKTLLTQTRRYKHILAEKLSSEHWMQKSQASDTASQRMSVTSSPSRTSSQILKVRLT